MTLKDLNIYGGQILNSDLCRLKQQGQVDSKQELAANHKCAETWDTST